MKKLSVYSVLLIGTAIIGCGGGSSDAPVPEVVLPSMPEKVFRIIPVESSSLLDLSSELKRTGSELANVDKVRHESNDHCPEPILTATGFTAEFAPGDLCSYVVETVNKNDNKNSTQVDVFVSNVESPLLPAKSETAVITEGQTELDIETLLGSDWPRDFTLDNVIAVTDSANGGATASIDGNSINVTFGSKPSFITVVYTLINDFDTENVMLGHLYVSVSAQAATDVTITPQEYRYTTPLVLGRQTEFNLTALPGLTIQTQGNWHLYSASGLNLSTQINGKSINVKPEAAGDQQLTYVLKNSTGSYTVGQILFTVNYVENARSWTDVTYRYAGENRRWISPTVPSEVASISKSSGKWDNGVKNTVAVFPAESAPNYCSRVGRLPYPYEIRTLIMKEENDEATGKPSQWPKGRNYWVQNPMTLKVQAAKLSDGSIVEVGNDWQYAACITYDEMLMDTLVSTVSGTAPVKVGLVRTPNSVSSSEYKLSLISDTLTEEDIQLSIAEKDDKSFYVIVTTTTQALNKSGDFRVRVDQASPSNETVMTMTIYLQGSNIK
ncbi:hypothetical protein [Photobacterium leiognathi]|uniref:hypothetical protein n=1 Tax=Photobacterium leiognathi TaxID=553611 RepID=UPI00273A4C60|nr:hypothetical protein [Photobacterium leiognathi]